MTGKHNKEDKRSIIALYKEYQQPVFRYLFRLTGCRHVAEELAQETFFQAFLSIFRFRRESKTTTWLFKVARNVYLNYSRKQARRSKLEIHPATELSEELAAKDYIPEQALDQKLIKENVLHAMKKLPEQYRTVILLKEVEMLSHSEIAEIMGKTVPTTKVLLFRAKQRFQEEYSKLGGDL